MRESAAMERLKQLHKIIHAEGQYRLGKDDMFQLLLCVGVHEHKMSSWLPNLSNTARVSPVFLGIRS